MGAQRFGAWWALVVLAVVGLGAAADTRLIDAARRADTTAVRALLKAGADVNAPQDDGARALHWAAHWDDVEMAELLLDARASVNAANELGATPLWLACLNGSPAMVDKLLKAGADPNIALLSGETPLMTAARTGSAEVVKLLAARGADLNARESTQGQTALMWAASERHPQVVRVLVEVGADVNARSQVRRRRVNTETGGFNPTATMDIDKGGYTALLFAAQQGMLESVDLLLAAGAGVDDEAPDGTSPLVVAAHSGHGAAGVLLLEKGANPNAAGAGYSALHAAILRGQVELASALLAHGANPNAPLMKPTPVRRASADYAFDFSLIGATPFWLAARFLEPAIMRALAANGADPAFAMNDGTTPLMAAAQGRRRVEPGFTADPIADEQIALDAVKTAVALGVDVNAANAKDGNTALHTAASRRLNSIVQFLVDSGAKVDVKNQKGQTPLAMAFGGAGGRGGGASGAASTNATAELLRKLGAKD